MRPWIRWYFASVGLLTLWVGLWGFLVPTRLNISPLPFHVPPLHARFLGALYLSGLTLLIGGMVARRWAEALLIPPIVAIWTGGLLIISLLHLDAFNLRAARVIIWFAAYLIFPVVAVFLIWTRRAQTAELLPGPPLNSWARRYLLVQGTVTSVLALALLVAPSRMVHIWPWPITSLLAQIYSAPLLAYGVGSLLMARQRTWAAIRLAAPGFFVFALGVLIASFLHLHLFSARQVPAFVWFGAFGVATMALSVLAVGATIASRRRPAIA